MWSGVVVDGVGEVGQPRAWETITYYGMLITKHQERIVCALDYVVP